MSMGAVGNGRLRYEAPRDASRVLSAVKPPAVRHVRRGRRVFGWLLLLAGVALVVVSWS